MTLEDFFDDVDFNKEYKSFNVYHLLQIRDICDKHWRGFNLKTEYLLSLSLSERRDEFRNLVRSKINESVVCDDNITGNINIEIGLYSLNIT